MTTRSPHLRRTAAIGVCVLVSAAAAMASTNTIGVLPPTLTPRALDVATATARVLVDQPRSLLRDGRATTGEYESAHTRAALIANLMAAPAGLVPIARRAGLDPGSITALSPVTSGVQRVFSEPDSERRADQLAGASNPYRLEVRVDQVLPSIDVYAQAPTVAEARRLADAAVPGMEDHLRTLARRAESPPAEQVVLTQLGRARGAVVNGRAGVMIAALTFTLVLAVTGLTALVAGRALARRGNAAAPVVAPRSAGPPREPVALRTAAASRLAARRAGDWPRTTRPLPWLVAVLMAVVWLVPFNDVLLDVPLPIDLYLDRLVLPVVVIVWLFGRAAAGADAPRLRITPIHLAVALIVGVAGLSLVLEARVINQALEFDLAFKKLALLVSYVALFVVVVAAIRRSEVRAFLTYTLGLAAACALGTLIEYRFATNVFYSLTDSLLPSAFQIGNVDPVGIDEIGRRDVRGPAQAALEVVAMLAMALPIAVTRLLESPRARDRALYALAVVVLLAAMVATFRKSAFLAPISVGLTLAYFRRRDLVKLAPLAVVLVLMIQVLVPGALSGVAGQFDGSSLGVSTVSDRTADYDAIRPDVWSHLITGRGYGSYEPSSYRILDMELLRQLVEVGVVGLLAYLLLAGTIVGVARRPIRERGPDAAVALSAAAAAVCFVTVSALFDVMSFPHVPYILLWMAALLAIVAEPARAPAVAVAAPVERLSLEPTWSA